MTKGVLDIVLEKLIKISRQRKAKIVFMGGIAVNIFARPRASYDIDGLISLERKESRAFLDLLRREGFKFDEKEPIKFINAMPFLTFYYPKYKTYVDFFIARNKFQYQIIRRALKIKLGKMDLYVVSPEDLILVKLQAGREKDLEDVREIILENAARLDFTYLRKWAKLLAVEAFLKDELRSLGINKFRHA